MGLKTLHLEDLPQQVEIARAKIISKDFGWSKYKMDEKNLLREDKTWKIDCNSDVTKNFFFPFEVKHSRPKLVEAYRRRSVSWGKKSESSKSSQDNPLIM